MSPTPSAPPAPGGDDDFERVWALADEVPGWLTRAQARVLWEQAGACPPGSRIVEIGSHRGRSTLVLAGAPGHPRVTAIDPFVTGRLFDGTAARRDLRSNLHRAGVEDRVDLLEERSGSVRRRWSTPVALVYVDGKHDHWTCLDDLRWEAFLPPGGTLLVHDAFSSIGVTTALLRRCLTSRTLRYAGRTGSLATFHRAPNTAASRRALLRELPWWVRNVGIKVLLRLRLRPVAAALGHRDRYDPY